MKNYSKGCLVFENHFLLRSQGQKNLRSALTLIRYTRDRKIETTYTTRRRSTAPLTFGHGEVRNQKEVYEGHIHYAPRRIKYPVQSFTHLQISISQGIMFEDFKLIWKIINPSIVEKLDLLLNFIQSLANFLLFCKL